jgi:chromosome segregation ATPase
LSKYLSNLFPDQNQITHLNGKTFLGLNNLIKVWLDDNECIKKNFEGEKGVDILRNTITATCGFAESDKDEQKEPEIREMLKNLETNLAKKFDEHKTQIDLIKEIYEKLEVERNATWSNKMREMEETIASKFEEIEQLRNENAKITKDENVKNQKIKYLEEKVKVLNEQKDQ